MSAPYHILTSLTRQWKNKTICGLLSHKIRSLKISSDSCFLTTAGDYVRVDELLPILRVFGERCQHLTITGLIREILSLV